MKKRSASTQSGGARVGAAPVAHAIELRAKIARHMRALEQASESLGAPLPECGVERETDVAPQRLPKDS
jgi:hypothetical protein